MLVVYIVMVQEVSPPVRILPVQQGIYKSFLNTHYDEGSNQYGFGQVNSQEQWWSFLENFAATMYPACDNGGVDRPESCSSNDFSIIPESGDTDERTYNGGQISRRDPTHANRVLFGVLVRQERLGPYKDCKVTDDIPYKRKLTHAINYCRGHGEANTYKIAYDDGTYHRPAWTTKPEGYYFQSDVDINAAMNKENGFWLPERLGHVNTAIVANYSKSSWMSPSTTEAAVVEWVSYNAENSVLAHVTLTTTFDSSGVDSSYNIEGLVVDYSEAGYASQMVCFCLGTIMLLAFAYRAFQTFSHRGWNAMVTRITEFDLFVDSVNSISLITTVFLCYWVSKGLGTVVSRYDAGFNGDHNDDSGSYAEDRALAIMRYVTDVVEFRMLVFKVFSAVGFVTQLLQFVKICTFHPQLDVLVKTVMTLVTSGVFFFCLFILAIFFFAITGLSLFGDKLEEFNNLGAALHTLCNVLMTADGFEYDGLNDIMMYLLTFYFYSFILIMSIIFMNLVLAIVVEAYDKMREDADRESSLSAAQVMADLKVQFIEFINTLDNGRVDNIRDVRSHRRVCWVLTTPQERGGLKGRHSVHAGDLAKALCLTHEGATRLISELKVEKLPPRSRCILDLASDSNGEELDVILPALENLRDEKLSSEAEASSQSMIGQQNSTIDYSGNQRASNATIFGSNASRARARYCATAPDSSTMDLESSGQNWPGVEEGKDDLMITSRTEDFDYPPLATPVQTKLGDVGDEIAPISMIDPDQALHQHSSVSLAVADEYHEPHQRTLTKEKGGCDDSPSPEDGAENEANV